MDEPQKNFVLLFRKLKKHPIYKKPFTCHYLTHCLISAWWNPEEDQRWDEGDEIIYIKRGQFYSTLKRCASQTGMSVQNIRTAQKNLVTHGFLTVKVTRFGRLITVCKYSHYQAKKKEGVTKGVTNAQQTLNKHTNKYNNKSNNKSFNQGPKKKEALPAREEFKTHPSGTRDIRAYKMLVKAHLNIKNNDTEHDDQIERLHKEGVSYKETDKHFKSK